MPKLTKHEAFMGWSLISFGVELLFKSHFPIFHVIFVLICEGISSNVLLTLLG